MVTDEDLDRFIRAVYNVAETQPGWRARFMAIMQEIGIEDFQRYQELAQRCEAMDLIAKRDDHYVLVVITDAGKRYVESGRTEA